MNLLFSGNDYVFDGIMTCLLSVFKRTKSKEPFNVYVLTMDVSHLKKEYVPISKEKTDYLDAISKKYNKENKVHRLDVTDIYMKEFSKCPNEQCYCSPYTLLRLFIDMIDEIPDKILYLDACLTVKSSFCMKPTLKDMSTQPQGTTTENT